MGWLDDLWNWGMEPALPWPEDRYLAARGLVEAARQTAIARLDPMSLTGAALRATSEDRWRWPEGGPTMTTGDAAFYKGSAGDVNGVTWTAEDMVWRADRLLEQGAVHSPTGALPEATSPGLLAGKNAADNLLTSLSPLVWAALAIAAVLAIGYTARGLK